MTAMTEDASNDVTAQENLRQTQITNLQQLAQREQLGEIGFAEFTPYTYEEVQALENEEPLSTAGTQAVPDPNPTVLPSIYYFHPDHLGTSTFLTDFQGKAYQFFLNLPFGEIAAQQDSSSTT